MEYTQAFPSINLNIAVTKNNTTPKNEFIPLKQLRYIN